LKRNCTAKKIEIKNALSIAYAAIPCGISAFSKKAANSLQPKPSISSILSNQNISKGCPRGHCLKESQPFERPFAPVCNLAGSLLPYVAHPSEQTFRAPKTAFYGSRFNLFESATSRCYTG
jgi:hypothetical protein